MRVHEERLFRIPIDELRAILREAHDVDLTGINPSLEGDSIVFALKVGREEVERPPDTPGVELAARPAARRTRRTRRRRNRIKTRGWRIVGKITNSQGLSANVYEPLVEALRGVPIPRSEQRKLVRLIMIRNRNDPSTESVDYYLDNTLEYLRATTAKVGS